MVVYMTSTKTLARAAGALYLLVAVGGGFAEAVRMSVRVGGDAAATASNIAQHATLFRIALATDLFDFVCFLGVGLLLYSLLKQVNPQVALAMLVINAVSVAMQAINMTEHAAALMVATTPAYGGAANALFFLDLHQLGYVVSQVFFGLYLLPLGYLVYRSGMFPTVLGIVLMVGCGGYLAGVAANLLSPTLDSSIATYFGLMGGLAELAFLLWLLIMGAKANTQSRVVVAKGAVA